ncbi:hypothetical protein [Chryseobacterium fistulae]|uniref:DUF4347 domain-containing protein n=1 Tax=Chryseobacterium fistulae TaxID=2675058 RepID=A0A6N4XM88_9FLAO|nr:hypothetical protein [Chryseobacterium fistulae]CAA7386998.1 hypothetical protein CHRY9393_01299 [Chryseobacterium fistulae]
MAEQEKNKGRITIIAKNITGNANGQILQESKRTKNVVGGQFFQNGKNGGVNYQINRERQLPLELRVLQIDGPFDENNKKVEVIEKNKWYTYKAIQFNREPKKEELQNLRWGVKYDDEAMKELAQVSCKGFKEITHKILENNNSSKLRIYAFFKAPNENVSVGVEIEQGEVLIIVGTEQHSESYGNKLMFPAQAVREIRENYKKHKHANILIFKDKFTEMQLSIIKRDAKKLNKDIYFKPIHTVSELINYINNGDKTINRSKQKISVIKIFSHGLPSVLDFGLDGKNEEAQRFKLSHVTQLNKESFMEHPVIYSYACRTGNSDGRVVTANPGYKYDSETIKLVKPEESLAQKLSEHLEAKVYAFLRRSNYTSTWMDGGNKEYKSKYMTIEDDEVSSPFNPKDWYRATLGDSRWDESLWNPDGAFLLPTSGKSPSGLLENGMFIFEKGKTPVKQ